MTRKQHYRATPGEVEVLVQLGGFLEMPFEEGSEVYVWRSSYFPGVFEKLGEDAWSYCTETIPSDSSDELLGEFRFVLLAAQWHFREIVEHLNKAYRLASLNGLT